MLSATYVYGLTRTPFGSTPQNATGSKNATVSGENPTSLPTTCDLKARDSRPHTPPHEFKI